MNMIPMDVFDANGRLIKRNIIEFDTVSGAVTSWILTMDGKVIQTPFGRMSRIERYPAPLKFRKGKDLPIGVKRKYWDHEGK